MTAVPDLDFVSDADLVGGALAGDRAAFAGIYDRYADRLHDYCVGMVRDRDAAADCVQDVFCTAATALNTLREPGKLRPWLYAIARNEALRRIRQRRREEPSDDLPEAESGDAGPDTLAGRNELATLIAEAAGGLSDRDRSVLELGYRYGLEGPELAAALGVTTANANKLVQRLRDTMERALGALLVARHAQTGGNRCGELGAVLHGWDGTFSILMRKRIARHIETCAGCEQDRRRLVNPVALLGGTPVFIPAPAWLREHTLGQVQLTSAGTPMGDANSDAPTQAQSSVPNAVTESFGIAGADGEEAGEDEAGPAVEAQPAGRVVLIMSLLLGVPLIALLLTVAWQRETNAPVSPFGITSSVVPQTSHAPAPATTLISPAPLPPAQTSVVTASAKPPTAHPAPSNPPLSPVLAPQSPPPAPLPLPPPRHHRPPIFELPPPSGAAPPPVVITGIPPTATQTAGPPSPPPAAPPGRRPPIIMTPVTTTPPVIF